MKPVGARDFEKALRNGGLVQSDPSLGIGRQLSYSEVPARTVVVQFLDNDSVGFRTGVAERVLDVADTWFLFPRHGVLPAFGLVEVNDESTAIEFQGAARRSLAEYLATRPMHFDKHGLDLYAVASEGQVLLTWDHHTETDGLCVQLQRVEDAITLVASLCKLGTELEMFSRTWGDGQTDL